MYIYLRYSYTVYAWFFMNNQVQCYSVYNTGFNSRITHTEFKNSCLTSLCLSHKHICDFSSCKTVKGKINLLFTWLTPVNRCFKNDFLFSIVVQWSSKHFIRQSNRSKFQTICSIYNTMGYKHADDSTIAPGKPVRFRKYSIVTRANRQFG